ncbi:MAG: DUF167 domain-containing protein [Rectinemataceae bacterium]
MAESSWIRASSGRLLVAVKVVPGASRTIIGGMRGGAILARIAAPPERGKANEMLVAEMARILGIAKSDVEIVSGASSRRKTLSLPALAEAKIRSLAEETG